jgi:hypothetical protein
MLREGVERIERDFAFFEKMQEKHGGTCGKRRGDIDFSGGRCMI